jgi:hypothetical protein
MEMRVKVSRNVWRLATPRTNSRFYRSNVKGKTPLPALNAPPSKTPPYLPADF